MDSQSLPSLVIKYFHGFGGSELQQVVISNNLGDKYLFFQLGVQFLIPTSHILKVPIMGR